MDALYRRHFKKISIQIRKSFGSGPPDPEDAVQVAFLKFLSLENRSQVIDAPSFIYIAARNFVIDQKRRWARANNYVADQIALDHDPILGRITPEHVLIDRERLSILVEAAKELTPKQRKILQMNRLEGKSYRQIEKETHWSRADVNRNMMAALAILMAALQRTSRIKDSVQGEATPASNDTENK